MNMELIEELLEKIILKLAQFIYLPDILCYFYHKAKQNW